MTTARPLPEGWRWVQFSDVVREVRQATRDPRADGLCRVVGLEHLDSDDLRLRRWDDMSDRPDGTTFTRTFRAGHVLFGKRRAYQRKVAVPDFDGVCSSDILVFEPSSDDVQSGFLPYLVQSDGFFHHAVGTSAGSLSPRTKWQELARYEFALPPGDEQARIVAVLDCARAVMDGVGRSLQGADAVLRASMKELLAATAGSRSVPCSALADVQVGKKLSPDKRQGVRPRPTLRAVNLRLDGVDLRDVNEMDFTPEEDESLSIRAQDILLVEGGNRDAVGAPTWVSEDPPTPLYIQNTIVRLRVPPESKVSAQFLYWIWRAKFAARHF